MPLSPSRLTNIGAASRSSRSPLLIPAPVLEFHDPARSPPIITSPTFDVPSGKPPIAPLARSILPLKKSKTAPLRLENNGSYAPLIMGGRKNTFQAKPLRELHVTPKQDHELIRLKTIVSRSPSPSYRRSCSVETGTIAELAKKHSIQLPTPMNRSPSPASHYSSIRSSSSDYTTCDSDSTFVPSRSVSICSTRVSKSPTPRRIFPQSCNQDLKLNLNELNAKEQSPVVFDANLTFVLGCEKQPIRQSFRPIAAHLDEDTASSYLSAKIEDFLKRTDHVMEEWRNLGHKEEPEDLCSGADASKKRRLERSKSAANIMIKGFTYYSRSNSRVTSRASSMARSPSITRDGSEDRTTASDMDELSETTAELAEERSAASLAAQRLDAETSERLRLDRDLRDLHSKNDKLQQASERLEVELVSARGAGGAEHASDTESGAGDADADAAERFRRRYERAAKELNAARAQLRRQHEDDLEQIVAVKKQLEKKLADAYEEADEQRQVAAGWKRKLQKLSNDAADLRSQLDEHSCRNNLLEKRQRKFDAELHAAHDELKRERSLRERTSRERDLAQAEKYAQDQNLADARMELELKEEKINALQKEIDEAGGGNGGDSELALLKKMKSDLEKKCHDQEEELDELAGQVQLLESSKLRLEMMLEQQRKESRIEAQQRDEELDEARSQAIKKVKALESQLEAEHGERTLLLRERHELERRLASLEEQARSENAEMEQQLQRLRRDVKRYRALLRDAQAMIEQKDSDAGTRAQIRDLKAQLEEAEVAVRTAQRAKSAAEQEASEATAAASEAQAARRDADQRATAALRDSTHNKSLLDDADEEAQELMKKYRACATALAAEQASARAAEAAREAGEEEARGLRERLADAQQRLAHLEAGQEHDAAEHSKLLELKTKELESKLELEQTTRSRLDGQISRLKDSQEKINAELSSARQKEQQAQDELRKLQRQFKEIREEVVSLSSRLEEATRARSAAEGRASAAATEAAAARRDARTAQRRAADLQAALAADLSPNTDNSHEDSDNDSYSSDESIETFLANHKISPTTPSKHNFQSDHSRSTDSRQSRSSAGSTKPSSPIKESFA